MYPDRTPQNAVASDQGLHYLLTEFFIKNLIKMKKTTPKHGNGLVELIQRAQPLQGSIMRMMLP